MGTAGRGKFRGFVSVAAAVATLSTAAVACSSASGSAVPTIHFHLFKDSSGAIDANVTACNKAASGAYKLEYDLLPPGADDQRQQLVRRLAAKDKSLDILGMDVVWAPEFASAGWVRQWPANLASQVSAGTLPTALQTGSWQGKLYAAPMNSNTQLLWYRKDLVPNPPTTWDEMIQDAVKVGKKVETQGAQYEGLTVWFNTMVNSAGGHILSPDGQQVVLDQGAQTALAAMKKLAASPAADPSLSNYKEDDARLAFESGSAAFQLNYPFVYNSAKKNKPDLFKNLGWAPFPRVDPNTPSKVTIGGIDLGVSAYSKHPDQAFQAAQCLRNADSQKTNATLGGLPPTLTALYSDPKVREQYPFADDIRTALENASVRPQTPAYTSVSLVIENALSPPRAINPTGTPNKLKTGIRDALLSKGLVP